MQEIKQSAPIREERLESQAALHIDMYEPSVLVMMSQEGFEGVGIYLAVLLALSSQGI